MDDIELIEVDPSELRDLLDTAPPYLRRAYLVEIGLRNLPRLCAAVDKFRNQPSPSRMVH